MCSKLWVSPSNGWKTLGMGWVSGISTTVLERLTEKGLVSPQEVIHSNEMYFRCDSILESILEFAADYSWLPV
jgi:hypothetical protein